MQSYYLMDGSMIYRSLGRLKAFHPTQDNWFRPLAVHPSMELAAPFLIAPELACTQQHTRDFDRALRAFPMQLHCAQLQSTYSLDALAQHLLQFVSFKDSAGDFYTLRFADSRVMAYVPEILTPEQWQALSAPFSQWSIATRSGTWMTLPLGEVMQPTPLATPFSLSDQQIEQLMHAGEPDVLLGNLGLAPETTPPEHIASNYETAALCVEIWRQFSQTHPQRSDRRVLRIFAQKALSESPAAWLHSPSEAFRVIDAISQSMSWVSVLEPSKA